MKEGFSVQLKHWNTRHRDGGGVENSPSFHCFHLKWLFSLPRWFLATYCLDLFSPQVTHCLFLPTRFIVSSHQVSTLSVPSAWNAPLPPFANAKTPFAGLNSAVIPGKLFLTPRTELGVSFLCFCCTCPHIHYRSYYILL